MNEVQLQTGVIPIVYTSKTIASNLDSSINTYKLWMASWDGNTSPPTNLGVWTDWAFKQYSGSGTVPGISGLADLDVFNGDSTAFSNLIGVYTGISAKHADNNFIMYPNPVVNNLIIESSHAVVIEITNIEGQLIKTLATTDNKTFIDVFSFPSGVYIVKVKTEKGIEVRKFVKE
jgi:hypothetical protein